MNQSYNFEDEINLSRIFEKFITYKKLILSITLFFSIIVSVFTFQIESQYKSVALVEIGSYKTINGLETPLESASALVNDINVNLLYKNIFGDKKGYQITPIEDSIVQIERKSYSLEESEKSLKKIIDFTISRHKDVSTEAINLEIESLETELENITNKISHTINDGITKLENELPYLDKKLSEIKKIIEADEKNLIILEKDTELLLKRASQSPTLNQVIHNYKMLQINLEYQRERVVSELEKLKNINAFQQPGSLIFDLQQKKNNLETRLNLVKHQIQKETKIIDKIRSSKVDSKKPLITIVGVLIGFLISLLICSIVDLFKKR